MTKNTVERSTRLGRIQGIERLATETYWGIRYAEPVRRFHASELATKPWKGVYDATTLKAMALQPEVFPEVYGSLPTATFAEDCLFLNIHAPVAKSDPRPVIVFIHGGSFTGGGANFYDGTALAAGADAVVVCINYRLGVFAALDLAWLGTERDGGGQLWLGDQINALRWIRDQIADYGGDPGRVTVIGESAGAVSVAALCAAPEAQGLVHRAVACSTGYLLAEPVPDVVATVAKKRRCSREQAVAYLTSAPAADLVDLQRRTQGLVPKPAARTPLLPGTMEELIAVRGAHAVPLIAGYATHEGEAIEMMGRLKIKWPKPLFVVLLYLVARAIAAHGAKGTKAVPAYLRKLKRATRNRGFGSVFHDLVWTDGFRRGAIEYCEMTRAAGGNAYLYVMDIPMRFGDKTIHSSHGIDLALTFNVGDDPDHTVPAFADHPGATMVARRWVRMLGHFARHGEPGRALGEWPAYDRRTRSSLRVTGEGCHVEEDVDASFRQHVWT